jgi:hypothetical protein
MHDGYTNGLASYGENRRIFRPQGEAAHGHIHDLGDEFYRIFFDARATNSSTLESKSLRIGDWFDFL